MTKTIMMKNSQIYTTASNILEIFPADLTLPVKVNFYLQKNIKSIVAMAQEIEQTRTEIFERYGKLNEEGTQYNFEPEVIETANKELTDLFDIEQEVKVNILDLDWFDNVELTAQQLTAITYMFNDEEE